MSDNRVIDNKEGRETSTEMSEAPVTVLEGSTDEIDRASEAIPGEGMRLENFISPRTFVAREDILPMLAGVPIGQSIAIGHIAGYVRGYERRDSNLPIKAGDKPPPPSIWLRGQFEATSYETGEVTRAAWAILPRVMGELVSEALDAGEGEAVLDLELGIAGTGRPIPYTYTVTTYRASRAQTALTAIRMRHQKRLAAKGYDASQASVTPQLEDRRREAQAEIRRLSAVKRKAT